MRNNDTDGRRTFVKAVYADIATREAREDAKPNTLHPIVPSF